MRMLSYDRLYFSRVNFRIVIDLDLEVTQGHYMGDLGGSSWRNHYFKCLILVLEIAYFLILQFLVTLKVSQKVKGWNF